YDAHDIETLEGLEAVRKRPGMYIGGTGSAGLMHLVWELIDNSVDEAAAGEANRVYVTFHRDGSVEVADNGRGIPIGKHPKRGVSALEVVLTELHAGGKFGGGAYASSGGLHGVGASVVNALSRKLTAEVDREGSTWALDFNERVAGHYSGSKFTKSHELKKLGRTKKTGTRVRFWPDTDIFDPDAAIHWDEVERRVKLACFLVPGLKITVEDKRTGSKKAPVEFLSRGGLKDLVNDLTGESDTVTEVITLSGIDHFEEKVPVNGKMTLVDRECTVDIAMRWVAGYDSQVISFVNTIPTGQGGTHIAGFDKSLTRAVNDVLLKDMRKLAKLAKANKHRAGKDDVQEGLVAVVKVTFPEPQFRGQTKQELGTPGVEKIVYDVVKQGMADWFNGIGSKKTHVNGVRDKIANAILNRVSTKQALDNKRKLGSLGSTGMPGKLADCRSHGPESELLIVEGDSAAGPAKQGRNAEYMAVLPLRGKVVNAGKATLKQVLDNTEAQALFTAIGGGTGAEFDVEATRYGRIIILCDADVDGSHIRCLVLTLLYKYMRPLIEAGRVFAAQPPLFSTKVGGETYRAFTEEHRDEITAELTKGNRKAENINWQRFKGLGEMNVNELEHAALNPDTRILRRLTIDDAEAERKRAEKMFDVLMGSDVAVRRDYIVKNSELFDADALDI
ncbi:MAG: type IIA DNA topoisomerase subunit B, partial [Acidimicrobiales bacterium]|nr:type IIA DNA topoisomerase subunit B [Acidimicrobiales bacterium]